MPDENQANPVSSADPLGGLLRDAPNELSALLMMATRYRLLCEMARLVSRESDIRQLAGSVVQKMAGIVDFRRCSIAVLDEGGTTYSLHTQSEDRPGFERTDVSGVGLERGVAGRAIRRDRITYLPDLELSAGAVALVDEAMEGGSLRSVLSIPLLAGTSAIGALTIGAERPNAYSSADIRMARQVGDVLGLALERQHRREQAKALAGRLSSKGDELNETVEQLEAATLELDAFVYAASHDLRAPLLSIAGLTDLAELALEDGNMDELRDHLRRVQRNVKRLDQVVVDMLQLSRARRMERQAEPTDVGVLVAEVVETLWAMDEAGEVDIRVQCDVPGRIMLERRRVRQILANLLSNSIKYRDREKQQQFVAVEAMRHGADLILRVTDNGIGIPEEKRERVFELFYRGSRFSYGSGLGLYLVRQHAHALGGSVRLVSGHGQTVFEVVIPVEAS